MDASPLTKSEQILKLNYPGEPSATGDQRSINDGICVHGLEVVDVVYCLGVGIDSVTENLKGHAICGIEDCAECPVRGFQREVFRRKLDYRDIKDGGR